MGKWWHGNGGAALAGFFALFAIGSESLMVRLCAVPLVAFAASIQGWVDGCEATKRRAGGQSPGSEAP